MITKQLTGSGHRWGQRIAVDIPVQVAACALPAIHGHLRNLSLSGALMETDHELPLHAYIAISVKLPEMGGSATTVMARVTRQLNDAVGVEWCEFAPRTVKDLLRSPSVCIPV
jgi:PilZ domain